MDSLGYLNLLPALSRTDALADQGSPYDEGTKSLNALPAQAANFGGRNNEKLCQ